MRHLIRVLLVVALAGQTLAAQRAAVPATRPAGTSMPTASPESVGMSSERLGRLHQRMQAYVDNREAGGIVTLVAREGKVVDVHASGFQDVESRTAMKTDTIFRIASMSKPITSTAIMMLVEEGKILLTDPVSKFIPAFRGPKVIAEGGTTVPARREITIRDLLSHRSGITYGFINGGPVGDGYRRDGVPDGLTTTTLTLQEGIDLLAKQPLIVQPGSAWNYSLSVDVLGRVVEVASGQPFDVFLKNRIFTPLGMSETSFDIPDAKWSRAATVYTPDGSGGIRPMKDPETFRNTVMSPIAYLQGAEEVFLRRRRTDLDGDRLLALCADARQRRHVQWHAAPGFEDGRPHDHESHHRSRAGESWTRSRFWSRFQRRYRRCGQPDLRIGRRCSAGAGSMGRSSGSIRRNSSSRSCWSSVTRVRPWRLDSSRWCISR